LEKYLLEDFPKEAVNYFIGTTSLILAFAIKISNPYLLKNDSRMVA
jgi:hypothetical protein